MSESSEDADDIGTSVLETLQEYYHVPVLGFLVGVMLWIRLQAYDNFIVGGDVYFRGNDPWYHYRETMYAVENYPNTLPFDPWTGFPYGRLVGQFGTLYDQITATIILLVGLGSPTEAEALRVMLVMSPLFGAAAAIPAYLICRRFAGRVASLVGILVLALLPGTFLSYTNVGFYDHHAGEVFFMAAAVIGLLVAFAVAEREKPVWELVLDRDVEALRNPAKWAALAGVLVALYMYTWQPGVLLVGITGVFVVLKMTSDVVHGDSPEPAAFAAAVSMGVTGLLMVIPLDQFTFGVTDYSLTQVFLPLAVAGGAIFLAFLARQWEQRDIQPLAYPAATFGLIGLSVAVFALVLPDAWSTIETNLLRTVGFSAGAETRTIGEAQPFLAESVLQQRGVTPVERIIDEYGLAFFVAALGAITLLAKPLIKSEDTNDTGYTVAGMAIIGTILLLPAIPAAIGSVVGMAWQLVGLLIAAGVIVGAFYRVEYGVEETFLVVWAAFIASAAFTQTRFNYYLAIVVVVLTAYFLQELLVRIDLAEPSLADLKNVKGWQVMVVGTVVVLLLVPLVAVATPAWAAGAGTGPGAVTQWDDSLDWMSEETPHPGELEGYDNRMEYYGTYERPADGDFDYPDGAYGVQSWWDYGHWITAIGERIPNANPFQQHATEAANFLLAPSEDDARDVLARQSDEGENTRYVMVDYQMTTPGSKFGAPIVWYDEDPDLEQEDFYFTMWQQIQEGPQEGGAQPVGYIQDQRYYESLMVRLYEYHGSAKDPRPIVVQWEEQTYTNVETGEEIEVKQMPTGDEEFVLEFDTMEEAEAYVEENDNAQIGGVGPHPSERVPALQHYRLVKASQSSAMIPGTEYANNLQRTAQMTGLDPGDLIETQPQWVKTFERVPGATIQGENATPGQEVTAQVPMEVPATGETFTYTQHATADEDGEFEFVVPYSTIGYDEYGPENGYTNVSVRATGEYVVMEEGIEEQDGELVQFVDTTDVHEGQVVGDDPEPVSVTLEPEALDLGQAPDEDEEENGTDGETDGDEETNGDEEEETEGNDDTEGSLAAPTLVG
ncbi:dolichyl-diphosphooligosaccharide--protein glycosyltransferase [Halalkaliarchaeum desulfuricum]|uniref:dolichyl-phosphooligosaccharide-protein glycotransferase n=1 Tax=Halalkaliarchaeum desulfuricum TaxID=2055893 RepID=A0A343TMB1_9EURY|nr:oligosaccharyl transferase, archaeosortase A system-associated [Halalkaliarchaeum desulfuricum]AUX10233.1 dolichyl-diphosphooligosaccharide--protein glycosyltransferase [Halalkaliarchaeum desulfuricum]